MNEQSRKKMNAQNHFNILDLSILLLALLAAVAIWQRTNLRFFFEGDRVKGSYSVSFTVSGVRPDVGELLAADTVLYLRTDDTAQELGRLIDDAVALPHTVLMPREEGVTEVLLPLESPALLVDFSGALLCRGVLREGALVLDNGLVLRPDMEMTVFTERAEIQILISTITENV